MASLDTDKQIDKHLKPVKSGEDNTSLELASEDNGARIKGDLEVTGYTDNIKLREEAIIKADNNLTLSLGSGVQGDLTIDVAGGQVNIVDTTPLSGDPDLYLTSAANAGSGANIIFEQRRNGEDAGQDGDGLGTIFWYGNNDAPENCIYSSIACSIGDATNSTETGVLRFSVLAKEAIDLNVATIGLTLTGSNSTNGQIDVDIGAGTASMTTIAGDVTINGDGIGTAGALTIDIAGDLTFDAHTGRFFFYDAADSDDAFGITVVGGTGATTLQTTSAAADGHLTLDSDGDLILDSGTGKFIAKKAGTEFSVAGSAYAGMILGYTTVGIDAADDSYTLTTSTALVNSNINVSFVAPPSGVVEIMAQIYFDASRRVPVLSLLDSDDPVSLIDFPNSNDVTNEHVQALPPSTNGDSVLRPHWVVTGLTAGTTYKWWLGAKTSLGSGGVLKWGGNVTNEYPPAIMRATALPAATTDFAVYG